MHTQIREPKKVRKDLLTNAINIIQSLKKFENIKLIKKEKQLYMKNFSDIMKELKELNSQFLDKMPKVHQEQAPIETQKTEKGKPNKLKKVAPQLKPVSPEYSKLEEDISRLKERLESI